MPGALVQLPQTLVATASSGDLVCTVLNDGTSTLLARNEMSRFGHEHRFAPKNAALLWAAYVQEGAWCIAPSRFRPRAPLSPRAAEGKGLPGVLVRDGVHVLEIAIRTALDHVATKLGLPIRVVEIDDGKRDTRIASSVLRFE